MKERMVTRTIETIEVCALYCNTEAMTMGECWLTLPGNTPECKLEKCARQLLQIGSTTLTPRLHPLHSLLLNRGTRKVNFTA